MGTTPDAVTLLVVRAVSDALETPVEQLPPLSNTVDTDALATFVDSAANHPPTDATVVFSYAGLYVYVSPGPTVDVRPGHEEPDPSTDVAPVDG